MRSAAPPSSPLTVSALAHVVDLFVWSGAVGAGNARGLGGFVTDGYGAIGDPQPYRDHITAHASEIRDVLRGVVAVGPSKPAPEPKAPRGVPAPGP